MIRLSARGDQHQSQALKILLAFLSRPDGLNALEPERSNLFQTLYANLYSTRPAIVMLSMDVLRILVEYYEDSFNLVAQIAKDCSAKKRDLEYAVVISKLTRGLKTEVQAGTRMLTALVTKSVAAASLDDFLSKLQKADILPAIAKAMKMLPEDQQMLRAALERLHNLCRPDKDEKCTSEQTNWQSDQLANNSFKSSSTGLAAKVTALTGLAELAGITTDEGLMTQVLTQHLRQMEEKLQAMSKEQQEAANEAIRKQQEMLDLQMEHQREAYEKKIAALMNNSKLDALERDNATLALQLEELKSNQEILMHEYAKNQVDVSEQNYLRQHKQLWLFYQCIQMKLNEMFLGYKTLASGLVTHQALSTKTDRALVTALQVAGDLVPLPGAATVAGLISGAFRIYKQRKAELKTEEVSVAAVSVSNMEHISEYCARVLALRYEPQLRALEDQGAKLLGECAVRRMMEAMRTGCLECLDPTVDNKIISKQLVDMIVQVEKRQGSLSIKHLSIPTVASSLKWHEQDIFKRPGIRTPEGEFYHSPGETDVAKYGYRVGTAEEAKRLNFMRSRTRISSALDTNTASEMSFHFSSGSLSRASSSSSFSRASSSSLLLPTLQKSPSISATPPPPPVAAAADPSTMATNEVEELKKLVQTQSAAMGDMQKRVGDLEALNADMNKRLQQMEALVLLLSAK